jgi:hypothetical protein
MKRGEGCWFDGLVGDWLVVCCHEGLLCWESGVAGVRVGQQRGG